MLTTPASAPHSAKALRLGVFRTPLDQLCSASKPNPEGNPYSTAGSFATAVSGVTPRVHPEGIPSNVFNGIADINEEGDVFEGQSISGSYVIFDNGYGSMTINTGNLEDVSQIGVYAVDPNINILDPNNTTSGTGGALLVDLDTVLNGTGILLPQTDVATSSFTGNYSFGASLIAGCDGICEIDFAGQGAASVLTSSSGFGNELTGNGLWDDPAELIGETSPTANDVTFNGQLSPDDDQTGRYFMSDLELQSADFDRDRLLVHRFPGEWWSVGLDSRQREWTPGWVGYTATAGFADRHTSTRSEEGCGQS